MTPGLPRRRGVVDGEVELHHPPSPVGKTPSAKFDAEALKAEYIHICRASAVGNMTKGKKNATHSGQIGSEWDVQ